jgi:hypothetical protein
LQEHVLHRLWLRLHLQATSSEPYTMKASDLAKKEKADQFPADGFRERHHPTLDNARLSRLSQVARLTRTTSNALKGS